MQLASRAGARSSLRAGRRHLTVERAHQLVSPRVLHKTRHRSKLAALAVNLEDVDDLPVVLHPRALVKVDGVEVDERGGVSDRTTAKVGAVVHVDRAVGKLPVKVHLPPEVGRLVRRAAHPNGDDAARRSRWRDGVEAEQLAAVAAWPDASDALAVRALRRADVPVGLEVLPHVDAGHHGRVHTVPSVLHRHRHGVCMRVGTEQALRAAMQSVRLGVQAALPALSQALPALSHRLVSFHQGGAFRVRSWRLRTGPTLGFHCRQVRRVQRECRHGDYHGNAHQTDVTGAASASGPRRLPAARRRKRAASVLRRVRDATKLAPID
eukprot:5689765-Prymnesium_polylepis.2